MRSTVIILGVVLGGCGLSDHFSVMLSFLRYDTPQSRDSSYSDISTLAKALRRNLFAHKPDEFEISTPLYNARDATWSVCARTVDESGHPMMVASIGPTGFISRWRAAQQDGCEDLDFTGSKQISPQWAANEAGLNGPRDVHIPASYCVKLTRWSSQSAHDMTLAHEIFFLAL